MNFIGTCVDQDTIEYLFGSVSEFARLVETLGDEFTFNDVIVKYDPETDIHSFFLS